MISPQSSSFFGENIKLVSHCPYCEARHSQADARILDENDGAKLVYIECRKCKTSVVCVVTQSPFGMTSNGVITDLTSKDVLKFKDAEAISEDNALELYEFFKAGQDMRKKFV